LNTNVRNVVHLNTLPSELKIALDQNGKASGFMIADNGVSADTLTGGKYKYYQMSYSQSTF